MPLMRGDALVGDNARRARGWIRNRRADRNWWSTSGPSLRPQRSHRPPAARIRRRRTFCVAADDAAMVAALLAPGPRLRRVLEAPSSRDGDVRAVRCAADAGGSSHALYPRRLTGRCAELASRAVRAVEDRFERLVLVGGQIRAPAALAGESRTPRARSDDAALRGRDGTDHGQRLGRGAGSRGGDGGAALAQVRAAADPAGTRARAPTTTLSQRPYRDQPGYSSLRQARGSSGSGFGVRSSRNEWYGATNGSGAITV
jgi:hypothetical protein